MKHTAATIVGLHLTWLSLIASPVSVTGFLPVALFGSGEVVLKTRRFASIAGDNDRGNFNFDKSKNNNNNSNNNNNNNSNENSNNSNNNKWDVESARRHLEDLIGSSASSADSDKSAVADKKPFFSTDAVAPHPPLTATARNSLTAEIQLLSQLEHSLDAANALNDLWLHERGARAARALQNADQLFQKGRFNQAQDLFLELIADYGPHWVEPLHRLAMLYYLQGRLDDARELEQTVLALKPWHIGSLSNIVRIAESQKDTPVALQWAARRLPTRLGGKRRQEWVHREVQRAMDFLSTGEAHLQQFLGPAGSAAADCHHDEPWQ